MRIVGRADFVQSRAKRRLNRGIVLVILGITLAVAGFVPTRLNQILSGAISNVVEFAGLGSLLLGALSISGAMRDGDSAAEGPVLNQLRARLDDEYIYLRHLQLPRGAGDADGVLLGPHGALVLAIRGQPGRFSVRGDDWFVHETSGQKLWNHSPTWELARPLRAIQRVVREEGLIDVPVVGAVVLVQGRLIEADQPTSAVVPVDRIATYVDYLRPEQPAPRDDIDQLVTVLARYVGGSTRQRR